MYGARTAAVTKIAMHTAPTKAGPLRISRRNASRHSPRLARAVGRATMAIGWLTSAVPDPWVQERVADVHDQVHHQEDRGEDQDERLDHDVVVVLDRAHHPGADAVPREDRLGQDGAGEQAAHLEADDRRDGQPRVAHDVPVVDAALGEALGPRGPDVVLVG